MGVQLAYLALCCVAVLCSFGFPADQRQAATTVALALLVNWLFCEWTYQPAAPQHALWAIGVPCEARDLWSIADLGFGLIAFVVGWSDRKGIPHIWAIFLWLLAVGQCCAHVARASFGVEPADYLWTLDKLLLAQVAVFILVGGRGVSDRLFDCIDRWRVSLWASAPRFLSRVRR